MLKTYRQFPIRQIAITLLVGLFLIGGDAFAQKKEKKKKKKKGDVAAMAEKPVIPDPVKVTSVEGITE